MFDMNCIPAEIVHIMCLYADVHPFTENTGKLITLTPILLKRQLQKQLLFQAQKYLTSMKTINVLRISYN